MMTRPRPHSFDHKRADLIAETAGVLLAAGVAQLPIRDLAERLNTSDRMLLYYFEDKDVLLRVALKEISERFAVRFFAAVPMRGRQDARALLQAMAAVLVSPDIAPFLQVWTDADARASLGEEPFVTLTTNTANWWLTWLDEKLDMDQGTARRDTAIAMLSILEGGRLIEQSVPGATAAAVRVFAAALP